MTISIPTVLILGAGASVHCKYPLGIDLLSHYSRLKDKDDLNRLPVGWDKKQAVELINKLTRSGHYSIDAALEKIDCDKALGKYLLALALKQYEKLDSLFPPSQSGWYQYLFNKLVSGDSCFDNNKLSIVTFNYDRSLEAYLHNALINRFSLTSEQALDELIKIPIIHVHGILGEYPLHPYETNYSPDKLLEISKSIQIIHEIEDADDETKFCNKYFQTANSCIDNAEKIYFLGFGFHFDNVRRFKIDWSIKGKKLVSANPHHTPAEINAIIEKLFSLGFNSDSIKFENATCSSLFRSYDL